MEERPTSNGFTLVELMVTVAIIGILAAAASFMYSRQVKKARASEVANIMAEISLKQESYFVENGSYLSTGTGDNDIHPASPGLHDPTAVGTLPDEWGDLGINLGKSELWCGYVSMAGDADDGSNIGSIASSDFGFTAPSQSWFYIVAQCPFNETVYFRRFDREGTADATL